MNACPPLPDQSPEAPDPGAWARGVIQRQVALQEELAEAGLRLALAIEQAATQAVAEHRPVDKDAALAFSRVSRAVRMAGLLQSKLIKDMDEARSRGLEFAAKAREAADAEAEDARLFEPAYRHKFRVERIVERLIEAEHDDEDEVDRLAIETGERLDDEDLYGDVLNRPIGELVALICKDLGLNPDWSSLAQQAWAREEIESRAEGSPFVRPPSAAAADGGGGPPADPGDKPGEEPGVVGAGLVH